jgi:hypothetical protein
MSDIIDIERFERLIAALLALLADREATIEALRKELENTEDDEG